MCVRQEAAFVEIAIMIEGQSGLDWPRWMRCYCHGRGAPAARPS